MCESERVNENDEKVNRARQGIQQLLDESVTASDTFIETSQKDKPDYVIHNSKIIALSKIDIDKLRKEIKTANTKLLRLMT